MVSELIELSSLIADIYDATLDPALWQQTLANISAYVGGYSAVLFWHETATETAQALYSFNDDPEYTRLYFEKYLSMDPFFPASQFVDAGVVYRSNDIVPQAELEETQFFKEWIEPQGIVDAIATTSRITSSRNWRVCALLRIGPMGERARLVVPESPTRKTNFSHVSGSMS